MCHHRACERSDQVVWKKLGRIYEPHNRGSKLASHAANPLAVNLSGDVYRIFFSGRDACKRSSVGYFDFDIADRKIVGECSEAIFTHGAPQTFFSHGVSVGCCYEASGISYILFMGWHIPEGGHWRGEIGRLRLDANKSLHLDPERPFLPLSKRDPISLSYPWVCQSADGSYRMWYGSTLAWDAGNGEMLHTIRQAQSPDGHNWDLTENEVPHSIGVAQAFSRPSVICKNGFFEMWFSYRGGLGKTYRIGYATSTDGIEWKLDLDACGIDVSSSGWDSEMIEYPFVFEHGGNRYMLYNGNGFGLTGIGLAMECR